jgi:hypothetical protein
MKIMLYLKKLVFGKKAQGEPMSLPTFTTTEPINRPSIDEWVKEFNFGSRYGHRGSFYERR